MKIPDTILLIASIASFLLALLHITIIFIGRKAYGYFGASQLIPLVDKGSAFPVIVTFFLVVIFAVCGIFGLSGAGLLPQLPLLRFGLITIGVVFTLRGLALVKEIPQFVYQTSSFTARELVFSCISLIIGLLYLAGVVLRWHDPV